ncbi:MULTISPECIES: protein translocase subunit SecD [unclassified Neptuniibacter]|jgi:preprotein translocase subunit SecD|uniref:protein translocase subunit SecD n=1 Tax=unclassified Neptuniibacter TaxID=2630693 RepID=UPI0026E3486A|nr:MULTISPECIES: protein translocase subunit SecD [unclassified Neptuniibacter]MDO6514483.1 protein translocase subunit SecD [Neptuniibacter sp. 2_MG-2023]MDO6594797.1 protein translocase subunit SecD [Neptuniibacter sp. 1_MG-2023]
MLNRYPLWKNLLILFVLVFGGLYAAPNLYPDDYAVQLTGSRDVFQVDQVLLDKVTASLESEGVAFKSSELSKNAGLIRFATGDDQLKAKDIISKTVGDDYIVALNLAPTTPDWLTSMGAGPMKLGLDLRGGVHFLLEVDLPKAVAQKLENYASEIKGRLREEKLRYRKMDSLDDGGLAVKFTSAEYRDNSIDLLRKEYPEFVVSGEDRDGDFYTVINLTEQAVRDIETYAIKQNLTTLRNRVNELGVAEPLVQRQGRNRIVVQLPGIQDTAAAKRIIGKTATLEFRLEAKGGASSARTEVYEFRSDLGRKATLEKDIIIKGDNVANAQSSFDENGQPQVNITLDSKGGELMARTTKNAVQRRMAVLFVEDKERTVYKSIEGEQVAETVRYQEKGIISLATIQSVLGNQFRITGLDGAGESSELALLLRAGALAAPIYFVEERTVGPSLGAQNIEMGVMSVQIGLALVLIFMLIYYRVFGLLANIALAFNLVLLIAIMSMLSATLTLPGIAGIVLTVGMAVDANVLIFARIKEELANGLPPQSAISSGFGRAFTTILDANITTLLAAVILFAMGTGPVKGFAITLSVGILTSMFTAIFVTRALVNLTYGNRQLTKLSI